MSEIGAFEARTRLPQLLQRSDKRAVRQHKAQPPGGRTDPVRPAQCRQGAIRDRQSQGVSGGPLPRRVVGAPECGGIAKFLMAFVPDRSVAMAWAFPEKAAEATPRFATR